MPRKLVFCVLLCCLAVFSRPEYLVKGEAVSQYDTLAAEELQLFWKQMYGAPLQELTEDEAAGKPAVFLGRTRFAMANGINSDSLEREEWQIAPVGENLIVAGGHPVGTLYGVYRLLDQLGVAFLAMDATVIPSSPAFQVKAEKKAPIFASRTIHTGFPHVLFHNKSPKDEVRNYQMWRLRNFSNGQETDRAAPLYTGKYLSLCQKHQWHTISQYVNPKLFDEHPEYFMMDKYGVRQKPKTFERFGDVCMTNPGARQTAVESLRKMIQENRRNHPPSEWCVVFDLSRLDASPDYCQCPDCRKLSKQEGSDVILLYSFANHIIREIRKEYPDVMLRISPSSNGLPPRTIKLEEGLLFFLTDNLHRDPFHPTAKKADQKILAQFDAWKPMGPPLIIWDYWNLPNNYFTPPRVETVFDAIKPDLVFFHEHNINGVFYEATMDWVCPQNLLLLNYYVVSQLLVDPSLDQEELADRFIRGYYGESAAPLIRRYFDRIRQGVREDTQRATSASVGLWRFCTPKFLCEMYRDLKGAAEQATDPRHAMHLHSELIAPLWCALYYWNGCEKAFADAGVSREMVVADCRAFVGEFLRRFRHQTIERYEKIFEERFDVVEKLAPRPERFRDVPTYDFRMVTARDFYCPESLNVSMVEDPDSMQGKAVRSANQKVGTQGIDLVMPGKYRFRTTHFAITSEENKVQTFLKQVPQDEKYHWFRIPGQIELKYRSNFWGHGWGIQARTSNWYVLTYGEAADNTWDQVWFSAKFTGPAYVPGSTQENAIYVDMAVAVRHQPDPCFQPIPLVTGSSEPSSQGLPPGWQLRGDAESASVTERQGKYDLRIIPSPGKKASLKSPALLCSSADVFQLRADCETENTVLEFVFLDKEGKSLLSRKTVLKGREKPRYFLADLSEEVQEPTQVTAVELRVSPPTGSALTMDNLSVEVARRLNRNQE